MFRKPFKIKSNTPVKSSERKNIKDKIHKQFPSLTEDDLNVLLPKKDVLNSVKIVLASNEIVQVYTVNKRPISFELHGKVFPTLFFLWQFPNIIYNFTTHSNVMSFINSGADLMLPGIITPPAHVGLPKYGSGVQKESIVGVNLTTNKATCAVGYAVMSSFEMESSGGKGRCVAIVHVYGDKLFNLETTTVIPNMGPPEWLMLNSNLDEFPALGSSTSRKRNEEILPPEPIEVSEDTDLNHLEKSIDEGIPEQDDTEIDDLITEEINEIKGEDMDELLCYCFLSSIKYSKTLTLPILTSNFYKLQMLSSCPSDKILDVKKSTYKKLKPFLDKMSQEGLITLKEIKKGVESIVAINKTHPKFESFYVKPEDRPKAKNQEDDSGSKGDSTSVVESYIITQSVLPIFNSTETKLQKGDTVLGSDVRKSIREYVTKNKCQHDDPKLVHLDATLSTICKSVNPITWEEVYEKVCNSMKNCFKVQTGQQEFLNKGKVSPILISVANRSGNKKVTLIDNLELFGVKLVEFAKECQHGAAASTSISLPPGKKTEQLLVQGNQVLFVYNLLVEKYKIPKRFIRGLENAPKKKKR